MTELDFCQELTDVLELDSELKMTTILTDLEEWDSMAHLGVISMFDMEFSKTITNSDLKSISSVQELFELSIG
jgi:acyl carrier protein